MLFYDWFGKEYDHHEISSVPTRHCVKAFIMKDSKILLVKPKYHELWELPGGGIKENENNVNALIREVFEESGFKINLDNDKPFHTTDKRGFFIPDRNHYCMSIVMTYFARIINEQQVTSHIDFDREILEIKWFYLNNLPKNMHYISKESIEIGLGIKELDFKYE